MFEVARSRRMCCSRVCSVSTNPRLPSRSRVSPAIRPGHPADQRLGGGEEPERGSAEVEAVSERLSLPDRDVDAAFAGAPQQRQRQRIAGADRAALRPRGRPRRAARGPRSTPRKFGCWTMTALTSSSSSELGEPVARAAPPRPPSPTRARASPAPRASADARRARPRTATATVVQLGDVAGRSRPRSAPRTPRRWRPAARSARRSRSGTRTSPAASPGRSRADTACTGVRNSERRMIESTSAGT